MRKEILIKGLKPCNNGEISSLNNFIRITFNSKIKEHNTKITENVLFESLCESFKEANTCNIASCEVIHGSKSFVYFEETDNKLFLYKRDYGKVKCELADLLLIAVNSKRMRLCFLQNKLDYQNKSDDSFKADMRQYYLLKNRPVIERKGDQSYILKNAKYPSICSYGVFFIDGNFYDMNYYSTAILEELNSGKIGRARRVHKIKNASQYRTNIYENDEIQYAKKIPEFVNYFENMLIGEELRLKDALDLLGDNVINEAVSKVLGIDAIKDMANDSNDASEKPFRILYKAAIIIKGKEKITSE